MSADKIEITYAEFDNDAPRVPKSAIGALYYAEWRRNGGDVESAFGAPHKDSRNEGEDALIPDDVCVALAMLVAPGLVEPVNKSARSEISRIAKEINEIATYGYGQPLSARVANLAHRTEAQSTAVAGLPIARQVLSRIIEAHDAFRASLPDDWADDPLSDLIPEANAALTALNEIVGPQKEAGTFGEREAARLMREVAARFVLEDPRISSDHAFNICESIRALPLPTAAPDPRDELLAKAREALDRIFSYVSYVNIHGVGEQPEPTGTPQPVRVSPDEFKRIFQDIGKRAADALADIDAITGPRP